MSQGKGDRNRTTKKYQAEFDSVNWDGPLPKDSNGKVKIIYKNGKSYVYPNKPTGKKYDSVRELMKDCGLDATSLDKMEYLGKKKSQELIQRKLNCIGKNSSKDSKDNECQSNQETKH